MVTNTLQTPSTRPRQVDAPHAQPAKANRRWLYRIGGITAAITVVLIPIAIIAHVPTGSLRARP